MDFRAIQRGACTLPLVVLLIQQISRADSAALDAQSRGTRQALPEEVCSKARKSKKARQLPLGLDTTSIHILVASERAGWRHFPDAQYGGELSLLGAFAKEISPRVKALACIEVVSEQVGIYVPEGRRQPRNRSWPGERWQDSASRIDWRVALVTWPQGELISKKTLSGGDPPERTTAGGWGPVRTSGAEPVGEFLWWVGDTIGDRSILWRAGSGRTQTVRVEGKVQSATLAKPVQPAGTPAESSPRITADAAALAALRRLGEHHRIGFSLQKTARPQPVGDIALQLTRTDPKRQTYTVHIVVDDKQLEKKDSVVNRAIQFYVAKSRQPYELIVTRVGEDWIEGSLSVRGSPPPGIGK